MGSWAMQQAAPPARSQFADDKNGDAESEGETTVSAQAPQPLAKSMAKGAATDPDKKKALKKPRRTAEEQVLEQAKKLEQRAAKSDPVIVKKVDIADKSSGEKVDKDDAAGGKSLKSQTKSLAKSPMKVAAPAATPPKSTLKRPLAGGIAEVTSPSKKSKLQDDKSPNPKKASLLSATKPEAGDFTAADGEWYVEP